MMGMREANSPQLLLDDDGNFAGLNLGADYTAEHEHGIDYLRQKFKMNHELTKRNKGMDRHLAKSKWDNLQRVKFRKNKKDWIALSTYADYDGNFPLERAKNLTSWRFESQEKRLERWKNDKKEQELSPYPPAPVASMWGEGDFLIVVEKKDAYIIDALEEALNTADCLIFLGGGGPFQNAGLTFLIKSKLDSSDAQQFLEADEASLKLMDLDKKYGSKIKKKLEKQGKKWFALSPRMLSEERQKELGTKYPITYWLNPYDQRNNNYGWFTIEDLQAWLKDEGPIPKVKEAA